MATLETFKGTGLSTRAASDLRSFLEVEKNKAQCAESEKKAAKQELALTKEKITNMETEHKNKLKEMAREYAAGYADYHRIAINAGIDVSLVEGDNFDPEEADPALPVDVFDLDLETLEEETREANEHCACEQVARDVEADNEEREVNDNGNDA